MFARLFKRTATIQSPPASIAAAPAEIPTLEIRRENDPESILIVSKNAADLGGLVARSMVAESASQALALMRTRQFDAICLDVSLDGESGYRLAKSLRQVLRFNGTILLLSSKVTDSDVSWACRNGAQGCVPRNERAVMQALRNCHRRQSAENAPATAPDHVKIVAESEPEGSITGLPAEINNIVQVFRKHMPSERAANRVITAALPLGAPCPAASDLIDSLSQHIHDPERRNGFIFEAT